MRCIAAPIFNPYGDALAGIPISGPTARLSDARREVLAAQVMEAARSVTETSGGTSPSGSQWISGQD